jgi:hypothetical protein
VIPYGPRPLQERTESKTQQLASVAAASPARASEMASFINKRAKVTAEAVTGDGDLVADVAAGRNDVAKVTDEDLPDNLRAMKPEARSAEIDKQIVQRKALNEKLATLVAKRDQYVAEHRKSAPKASSFDRVVEDTLKAQIKR